VTYFSAHQWHSLRLLPGMWNSHVFHVHRHFNFYLDPYWILIWKLVSNYVGRTMASNAYKRTIPHKKNHQRSILFLKILSSYFNVTVTADDMTPQFTPNRTDTYGTLHDFRIFTFDFWQLYTRVTGTNKMPKRRLLPLIAAIHQTRHVLYTGSIYSHKVISK